MNIKKYRTEDIVRKGYDICPKMTRDEYFNVEWIKIDDMLKILDKSVEKGNLVGGGFSSALFLSDLLKHLRPKDASYKKIYK